LFVIISRRFSWKLEQFNERPRKWISLRKIKTLLRFCTVYLIMDYGRHFPGSSPNLSTVLQFFKVHFSYFFRVLVLCIKSIDGNGQLLSRTVHCYPAHIVIVFMHSCSASAKRTLFYYRAMHFSAKRGLAIACRPSDRLSVCL